MKDRITIRPAEQKDWASIASIHAQCFSCIGQTKEDIIAVLKTESSAYFFIVAEMGKNVQGYAIASTGGRQAYFSWMGVLRSAEKRGIGSKLISEIEKWSSEKHCASITLDSRNRFKKAVRLYLSNEYDISGTWIGSDEELMIRMKKPLRK